MLLFAVAPTVHDFLFHDLFPDFKVCRQSLEMARHHAGNAALTPREQALVVELFPKFQHHNTSLHKIYSSLNDGFQGNHFLGQHGDKKGMLLVAKLDNGFALGICKTKAWQLNDVRSERDVLHGAWGLDRADRRIQRHKAVKDDDAVLFTIDDQEKLTTMKAHPQTQAHFILTDQGPAVGSSVQHTQLNLFSGQAIKQNALMQLPFDVGPHFKGLQARFGNRSQVVALEAFVPHYKKAAYAG